MAFETEDHIRIRAYHLWEASGRPEGRDQEFWEQARRSASEGAGNRQGQASYRPLAGRRHDRSLVVEAFPPRSQVSHGLRPSLIVNPACR